MSDLYDTLGVKRDATEKEIKDSYRTLAKETHPDKQSGDTEKFQAVQLAYSVLSDKEKRERYDKTGSATGKPSFDSILFGYINEVVEGAINSDQELDIVELLKEVARGNVKEQDKAYAALTKKKDKIQNLLDSFKIKKGTDHIKPILLDKIKVIEQQQANIEEAKQTFQDILDVVCGYEYDYTPKFTSPVQQQRHYQFAGLKSWEF